MGRPRTQYAGIAGQSHLLAPPRLLRRVKANLKAQRVPHPSRIYPCPYFGVGFHEPISFELGKLSFQILSHETSL